MLRPTWPSRSAPPSSPLVPASTPSPSGPSAAGRSSPRTTRCPGNCSGASSCAGMPWTRPRVDLLAALGSGEPRRDEVYLALASDLAAEDNAALVTRAARASHRPRSAGARPAAGAGHGRPPLRRLRPGAGRGRDRGAGRPGMARAPAADGAGPGRRRPRRRGAGDGRGRSAPRPRTPLVDLEYARLLADAGKVDEAREKLAALTAQFGDRPEINRTLAFLDLAAGDLDGADQRFDALDDAGAERFEAFYYRGPRSRPSGATPKAPAATLAGSVPVPTWCPAQLGMAESLVRAGQAEEAVEQLTEFGLDHPAQAFDVLEYKAQVLQLTASARTTPSPCMTRPCGTSRPPFPLLLARGALLEQQGQAQRRPGRPRPGRRHRAGRCHRRKCLRLHPGQPHRDRPARPGATCAAPTRSSPAAPPSRTAWAGRCSSSAAPRRRAATSRKRWTGCRIRRSPATWPTCSGSWATGRRRPSCSGRPRWPFRTASPVRDTVERLLD